MADVLPTPFFSGGLKLSYATTVSVTYDGTTYDAVFTAAESFDHAYAVAWALYDRWVADGAPTDTIVPWISIAGYLTIESDMDLTLSESIGAGGTADHKILAFLGLDPDGYVATNPIEGLLPLRRGFFPQLPLMKAPEYSRTLQPARATYRLTDGGLLGTTSLAPQGGHTATRFSIQYIEDVTAQEVAQTITQLLNFLCGERPLGDDIEYGGAGFQTSWTGSRSDDLDGDALGSGGASESPFSYFERWEDFKADYQPTETYATFRAAQDSSTIYHLHPDLTAVQVTQKWEGMADYWLTEFDALEAP